MSNIAIIGSGFSGLSAAAVLSKQGHAVTVYEKKELKVTRIISSCVALVVVVLYLDLPKTLK